MESLSTWLSNRKIFCRYRNPYLRMIFLRKKIFSVSWFILAWKLFGNAFCVRRIDMIAWQKLLFLIFDLNRALFINWNRSSTAKRLFYYIIFRNRFQAFLLFQPLRYLDLLIIVYSYFLTSIPDRFFGHFTSLSAFVRPSMSPSALPLNRRRLHKPQFFFGYHLYVLLHNISRLSFPEIFW